MVLYGYVSTTQFYMCEGDMLQCDDVSVTSYLRNKLALLYGCIINFVFSNPDSVHISAGRLYELIGDPVDFFEQPTWVVHTNVYIGGPTVMRDSTKTWNTSRKLT